MKLNTSPSSSSHADDGIEIKRDHAEVLGAIIGANAQAIIDGLMSCKPMEDMEHFFRRLRDPNLSAQAALRVLSKCGDCLSRTGSPAGGKRDEVLFHCICWTVLDCITALAGCVLHKAGLHLRYSTIE